MITSTSFVLSWDPPAYEDQNGEIIHYVIDVMVQETGAHFLLQANTSLLNLDNLAPYRTYVCVIAAATSAGSGPFSDTHTVQTLEDGMVVINI